MPDAARRNENAPSDASGPRTDLLHLQETHVAAHLTDDDPSYFWSWRLRRSSETQKRKHFQCYNSQFIRIPSQLFPELPVQINSQLQLLGCIQNFHFQRLFHRGFSTPVPTYSCKWPQKREINVTLFSLTWAHPNPSLGSVKITGNYSIAHLCSNQNRYKRLYNYRTFCKLFINISSIFSLSFIFLF